MSTPPGDDVIDVDKLFGDQKFQEKLKEFFHSETAALGIDKLIETMSTWREQDKKERQQDKEEHQIERQQDKEERQQDRNERQVEVIQWEHQLGKLGARWGINNERIWRTTLIKLVGLTAPNYRVYRFEQDDPDRKDKDGRSMRVELDVVAENSTQFIVEIST
ncbi:hypothetical protein GEMRC1_003392 [Eukaryota sp. GEM-RC1]